MKIDISTYAGLEQYYQGFNARHLSSMLVIGAAGLQKSMTAERLCPTVCEKYWQPCYGKLIASH